MQEVQETCVSSLGWEDPLEEGMATHSSLLARIIPYTEELGRLLSAWVCDKSLQSWFQSFLTLGDPLDSSPSGSSAHGIIQQEYWCRYSCIGRQYSIVLTIGSLLEHPPLLLLIYILLCFSTGTPFTLWVELFL